VPIYEELDDLLRQRAEFVVCYCDLDNFKPFNDKYGYEKGDQVIKLVAELVSQEINDTQDFVGHIGGDDFIIIFRSEDWRERCEQMLQRFEERVREFYHRSDIEDGGIWSQDRGGNHRFFPLLTLSIGSVSPDPVACRSHHDVAALAAGAKKQAKVLTGNVLFIDRRRKPFRYDEADKCESLQREGVTDGPGFEPAGDAQPVPVGG
jgi:GGDEF domain-containing protein